MSDGVDVQAIEKLARDSVAPVMPPSGNVPYAVIPEGSEIVDLTSYVYNSHNPSPERMAGTITALDAESLCEYYNLFSDLNSRVFADETKQSVLAILDYHGAKEGGPRWCEHRVFLALRKSEEWKIWAAKNGIKQSQIDFGEFIENNSPDIVTPDGATMLEVARDLSAKSDVDFGSVIRMANGSVQFKYSEQVKGSFGAGNLDVPERFIIAIPVHVGGERVKITARLRYRIASGKLTFWYDLLRAEEVERQAFLAVRNAIAEKLSVTIINGAPAK